MSPRPALHQRSESDTNARAFPNPASTLKIVHRSSTSSESKPANHGKPNSSSTSTVSRSGTVRSQVSFESLPPVQPLQIRKSRSSKASFGIFQDPEPVVEYALQGGPSCSSVPPTPVSGREPTQQKQPCTPPKMPTPPPRSILKKPSRPTLTPCTEEEYLNKSCEWISNQTSEYTPHRARMNSHTLRLVHDEDEFDIAVSRPRVGDDEISEIETTPTSTLSRSASDAQSTRSVRVPDWAKYVGIEPRGAWAIV